MKDSVNHLSENDIVRLLGVEIPLATAAEYLSRLEFRCRLSDDGTTLEVTTPSHRLDIGEGVIGKADVLEEIARLFDMSKSRRLEWRMNYLPPMSIVWFRLKKITG